MTQRYVRRFVGIARWLPDVAVITAPTRDEFDDGLLLTPWLYGVSGFQVQHNRIEFADVITNGVIQRTGSYKLGESSLVLYDDLVDDEARGTLAAGVPGFVVLEPYGDVAGRRCEVWPGTAMVATDDDWTMDPKLALVTIPVALTSYPTLGATVPAA